MNTESGTAPTRLIVNADDLGLSRSVNRGIIECVEAGAIRCASLLACGRAFDDAIELVRAHPELDLGIHLCLDEETPILDPEQIPTLVGPDGRFLSRVTLLTRLLVTRAIDLGEVRAELRAQFRRCADTGLPLSHFDGHGHVHVYPRVVDVVIELAREFGIRSCRIPAEPMSFLGRDFRARSYVDKTIVTTFSKLARSRYRAAGIVSPDHFLGMSYGGRLSPARMQELIDSLPAGETVEIMSHPGIHDPVELSEYQHWNYDWDGDRAALHFFGRVAAGEEPGFESGSFKEMVDLAKDSNEMGSYWDDAILEWEETAYADAEGATASVSLVERLAGKLRGHIGERQQSCLRALRGQVDGKVCVELGSATGSTCFALLEMGASKVIGLDISQRAVESARAQAAQRGIDETRLQFIRYTCGDPLPFEGEVDVALGLGILEYIEPGIFRDYLERVGPESIFFSFDERRVNLQKVLHFFYRNFKQIPYYKMYGQPEIRELAAGVVPHGSMRTFREGQNAFVTNLPAA